MTSTKGIRTQHGINVPYLISLHQASYPTQTIDKRPAHRVAFAVHPGDGTVHWYEGTLSVDELFAALKPVLRERIEKDYR